MCKLTHSPVVSWILCTHVITEDLKRAINSCLAQTFTDFEIIIIVNGPNFNEICQQLENWYSNEHKIKIYSTEIRHLNFSLNLGLHYAAGEFIARMDGDDISSIKRLDYQVSYMRNHPNIGVLGTGYSVIDSSGIALGTFKNPSSNKSIKRSLFYRNPLNHPSVLIRKKILLDAGGYMGGMHAEDYDLWCRLSDNKNVEFANLPESLLFYRMTGISGARKSLLAYASQAATQLNAFLVSKKICWLLGALTSTIKAIFISYHR